MSVSRTVIDRRQRIAQVLVENFDLGEGVNVKSTGSFTIQEGNEYTSGEYSIPLFVHFEDDLSDDDTHQVNLNIVFAPESDEVYEVFALVNDTGNMLGEPIVGNPDLVQSLLRESKRKQNQG